GGAGVVIVIAAVATVVDAWVDLFRHDRGAGLRDALGETATRTADGAGGLDPADRKTPRGIDQRLRRRSCAKTRAQRSKPFQSLRHARGHWRIEARDAGCRIAGRAGATERRCPPPLLCLLGVHFDTRDPRARLPVEAGLPAETHAVECAGGVGRE